MNAPPRFIVAESFTHRSPEFVRSLAVSGGFTCRTRQGTSKSEIWAKNDEERGAFWIIRMDSMGHDTRFHFGSRPHYHKNWVDSEQTLQKYLNQYTPEAWVYADNGSLIGRAGGTSSMHPDLKAKSQHIPR